MAKKETREEKVVRRFKDGDSVTDLAFEFFRDDYFVLGLDSGQIVSKVEAIIRGAVKK